MAPADRLHADAPEASERPLGGRTNPGRADSASGRSRSLSETFPDFAVAESSYAPHPHGRSSAATLARVRGVEYVERRRVPSSVEGAREGETMSGDNGSGEEPRGGLSRAQLIRRAGVLGAAAAIPATAAPAVAGAATAADTPPPEVGGTSALKALTAAEAATLEAFLERLLPSGAAGPGAKEANVLRYIDWSLAGDLSAFHPPYSAALAATRGVLLAGLRGGLHGALACAAGRSHRPHGDGQPRSRRQGRRRSPASRRTRRRSSR